MIDPNVSKSELVSALLSQSTDVQISLRQAFFTELVREGLEMRVTSWSVVAAQAVSHSLLNCLKISILCFTVLKITRVFHARLLKIGSEIETI